MAGNSKHIKIPQGSSVTVLRGEVCKKVKDCSNKEQIRLWKNCSENEVGKKILKNELLDTRHSIFGGGDTTKFLEDYKVNNGDTLYMSDLKETSSSNVASSLEKAGSLAKAVFFGN